MRTTAPGMCALVALILCFNSAGAATQLITNGGFETGTFAGWTVNDQAGSSGSWFVVNTNTTPLSSFPTVGPASGQFYAVTDQGGPGTHVLTQSFTVPSLASSVILSFDMFVNDSDSGPIINPIGLDYSQGANQQVRVDILAAGSGPFDTGAGVLANFYVGVDSQTLNPNPYTAYTFDITALVGAGGTFILRFAEVDNQLFLNQGIDNVGIEFTAVPEPGALVLGLCGIGCLAGNAWLRRRAPSGSPNAPVTFL
jgi:hypothetical protein